RPGGSAPARRPAPRPGRTGRSRPGRRWRRRRWRRSAPRAGGGRRAAAPPPPPAPPAARPPPPAPARRPSAPARSSRGRLRLPARPRPPRARLALPLPPRLLRLDPLLRQPLPLGLDLLLGGLLALDRLLVLGREGDVGQVDVVDRQPVPLDVLRQSLARP